MINHKILEELRQEYDKYIAASETRQTRFGFDFYLLRNNFKLFCLLYVF